jgi:cell division protein FtsX
MSKVTSSNTELVFTVEDKSKLEAAITKIGELCEEMACLHETLEVMSDSETVKNLVEALNDVKAGRVYSQEEMIAEFGFNDQP